ncbi:MAG: CoA-binding protein [Anaerolineaceae bacterium]|nr:CoA-binding protein [Anaerolineaceae bacterium]
MPTMQEMVTDFLAQKRIAVAGVSRDGAATGNSIYKKLKDEGYEVFAINPHATTIGDDPCYPDVKSTPVPVDTVMIVTKPSDTDRVVRDCAEAGIKRVWMHCSVMHGSSASETAIQFGQEHGITVIPSGCPFMYCEPVDFFHKGMRWWMNRTNKLPK